MTARKTIRPVVGIDAGGTSVRVVVADAAAAAEVKEGFPILAERQGEADPEGGPSGALTPLRDSLDAAGLTFADVGAVCAGITKISRGGVREAWEAQLASQMPQAKRQVVPDFVVAFHGALPEGAGVVVIAGTGSVVYGEDGHGGTARVGGRGWEFGDEGSGAWLTGEIIRRTMRVLDGIDIESPLTRAVCDELHVHDIEQFGEAARERARRSGRGFLVPLALRLSRAGLSEGEETRRLFIDAGRLLGEQAKAAISRLSFEGRESIPIAAVGGLWEAGDLLKGPLRNYLRPWVPNAVVQPPASAPVIGAARLAARMLPGSEGRE